ncbi:MAG: carbohydrate ABC transporter permease [Natronomonas sp.]|uniref:carbohydrate ABC transporter permease n=1 Tax=Natronomonas sp. TaxID=2184060 RepID=UPI00286FFE2A|nr:carbohydrate ABC transporter permease [Natronomonas sp.]MDR9431887.1 carbohydrate ABC transporter permease [Natronomonas sp.]
MQQQTRNKQSSVARIANRMMSAPEETYKYVVYLLVAFFGVMALFPYYWLTVVALTPLNNLQNMGLVPKEFNPQVFQRVFEQIPFHHYMFNSLVIASLTTVMVLILASFAGYVFGRLEFKGRKPMLYFLLVLTYFPPAVYFIPIFNMFTGNLEVLGVSSPRLFNQVWGINMPLTALLMPFSIYLLTTFYSQILDGLEDASRVEGTTRIGALFRVIFPLSAPGVAATGTLVFITVYNEFFFSFLMTSCEPQNWGGIVCGLLNYQTIYVQLYNVMAAASLAGTLPIILLVVFAQDKIVSGLMSGGMKGN